MAELKDNSEKLSKKGIIIISSVFIVIFAILGYLLLSDSTPEKTTAVSKAAVNVKGKKFDGTIVDSIDKDVANQVQKEEDEKIKNANDTKDTLVADLPKDIDVIDLEPGQDPDAIVIDDCELNGGYDIEGFHCETGFDKDGYDRDGYNNYGYDRNGCDKNGLDINEKICLDVNEGKACSQEACEELLPIYNEEGFDREGYDKDGYNKEGFDREGYNKKGYDKEGFDRDGYDKEGFDREGFDRQGYDKEGFDRNGYDRNGFNREGYDKNGYDRNGFNKEGFDREGFDKNGFDKEGYDRNGFNKFGCNREGLDRNGNPCKSGSSISGSGYDLAGYDKYGYDREGYDKDGYNRLGCDRNGLNRLGNPCMVYDSEGYDEEGYDKDGYDRDGYDRKGFDRNGFDKEGYDVDGYNKYGYDREGYDKDGYNRLGCDKNGLNRLGNPCMVYDSEGYDEEGYDKYGYDREGYDRKGFDKDGYNRFGCDVNGLNREGEPCKNEYVNGFDAEGFDKDGCNKNGINRLGKTCLNSHRVRLTPQEMLWHDEVYKNKMAVINQMIPIELSQYDEPTNVEESLKGLYPELAEADNVDNSGNNENKSSSNGFEAVSVDGNNNGNNSENNGVHQDNGEIEIPTGSMIYASLLASVNSDYPGIVRAQVIGGPLNGALFIGSFNVPFINDPYRPRDRMQFNFDKLVYKRRTYSINSVGMDLKSLNDYVASYADHHYVTRWGGLIVGNLLKGLGKAAYGSGTESAGDGDVVSTPITESKEQLKVAVGEIGNELADMAKQQFYRPPTVVANRGKTIGIYFVTEVDNDELPILFKK